MARGRPSAACDVDCPAVPTRSLPRIPVLAAPLAVLLLVLSGCGNRHDGPVRLGETEGIYVEADELTYQVQLSRVLNPDDREDREVLIGIPESSQPGPGETWFGVFLRVQNQSDEPRQTSGDFEIRDTSENVYRPLNVSKNRNPFVYAVSSLEPRVGILPAEDTAAYLLPTRGELLIFKLPFETLQNRPLEFVIGAPGGDAIVDLDV